MQSNSEVKYILHLKNFATVVEEQVKGCDDNDIFTAFRKQSTIFHPLNAIKDIYACNAVECEIKGSKDSNAYQKCKTYDKIVFVIACVQLFGDKPATTLSVATLQLYHLYTTPLSFTDVPCRDLIASRYKIIVYLLVSLNVCDASKQAV